MKHKILSFCVAALIAAARCFGGMTLAVPDVTIAQGGTANVLISFDLGTKPYTAYQFDISYPTGISSVTDAKGDPVFTKGDVYAEGHNVSSVRTAKGLDRFQCFSIDSDPFTAQNGVLLTLTISAQKSLATGTYEATVSPIEFVQTDATPDRPEPVKFNITVTEPLPYVLLDETATTAPKAATGVDVLMKRNIKANQWSTIVLPFAMSEAQTKEAFGSEVQLADFKGYEVQEDAGSNVVGITVNFKGVPAPAIEANHPYIIKVPEDITEFYVENVDVVPSEEPVVAAVTRTRRQWSEMIGTYVVTPLEADVLFISGNNFYYSAGKTQMKAFRAYFDFYDVLKDVEESNVKMLVNGDETRIDDLHGTSAAGSWFDLQGRKVYKAHRGSYIVDGKKVILK